MRVAALVLAILTILTALTVGADVALARSSTPKQINQTLSDYLGIPGFQLYRGGGAAVPSIYGNAYWNPRSRQLHINRDWYSRIRQGKVDRETALAFAVLGHEIGHIGQPLGVPNGTGGLDITPEFLVSLEDRADDYARANIRKIINRFFTKPRERQLMTKWGINQFNAFRKAHPYTVDNAGGL